MSQKGGNLKCVIVYIGHQLKRHGQKVEVNMNTKVHL